MALSAVQGQKQAVTLLTNSIDSQKLAHAYLFHGPSGVGKRFTGQILAKLYLCEQGSGCGQCSSCQKIDSGNHPDFHMIEPEGASIKIDQIRTVQSQTQYKPYLGKGKVYILEQADTMTIEAANAFLKVLEEPPAGYLFILLTEKLFSFLPTILSRCQQVQFFPLAGDTINALMAEQELDNQTREVIAGICGGSIGTALQYTTDSNYLNIREKIYEWLLGSKYTDIREVFAFVQEIEKHKNYLEFYLDTLEFCFRDALMYLMNEDLIINKDKCGIVELIAKRFGKNRLLEIIEMIEGARGKIKANVSYRLVLENFCFQLQN